MSNIKTITVDALSFLIAKQTNAYFVYWGHGSLYKLVLVLKLSRTLWGSWAQKPFKQLLIRESTLNTHWKDWSWSWSSRTLATWCEEPTHWKSPWCWERLKAGGEGYAEDEMVGWCYQFNEHEFEQTPGDCEGQGRLSCCSPWGHKESDRTGWLNNHKQGREGVQRQGRNNQETIVQHWDRTLVLPQGIHTPISRSSF